MPDQDQPQLYLISPPQLDLFTFSDTLGAMLDARDIACFRLALTTDEEDEFARAADVLREVCHTRDVAVVIDQHFRLVEKLGLDGCHLPDGPRLVREVRKDLGADAIVGAHCGVSRHAGMAAGEAGADYVCFGPMAASTLGDGEFADMDLFKWWSEVIEVPIVAEGGLDAELVAEFAPYTDFFALGAEIWRDDTPVNAMNTLLAPLG